MMYLSIYRNLPFKVYILAMSRFVIALGSFVVPFLSLILTDKFEFSYSVAGIVITIATLCAMPGNLLGGFLADRYNKKKSC